MGISQNYEKVLRETNVEFLLKWAEEKGAENEDELAKAIVICREKGYPLIIRGNEGQVLKVDGLDELGRVTYVGTINDDAAKTISTDKIQSGGLADYNLSGRGINGGVWDSGRVRGSHQELQGKITMVDGSPFLEDHATHVAGTMVAHGVRTDARGMAFEGILNAYDWSFDEVEMANAAANGMLVSNHSYGTYGGWENIDYSGNGGWHWLGDPAVSTTEDFRFGRYNSQAKDWDDIAFNAPYYTIVKAAGNQRDDNGPPPGSNHYVRMPPTYNWTLSNDVRDPDGQNDCINTYACTKNVIIVGAVNAIPGGYNGPGSVQMSGFSSWGPMDDGRIKPDIVGNGVGVLSCLSGGNDLYASWQGTSMSSPTISGSIMLLQEHHSNLNNGDFMKSELVHALLIHTADEAGSNPGPDYSFGWGLANMNRAAEYISLDSISILMEGSSLSQGQTDSWQINATGNEPLKATIVWHEPGSIPLPTAVNDPTPILINDLDMRIYSSTDTTLPWTLDRVNPSNPAVPGDNTLDNVEVIEISNPSQGSYTISVSHKGALSGGSQTYSLIVSGISTGDTLNHCRPLVELNSHYGQFTDGSGTNNYKNDQDCAWLIDTWSGPISLEFDAFDLENQSDFVRVFDGNDNTAPLLGSFTGSSIPAAVTSTGSQLYVEFTSDNVDASNSGFVATYSTPCLLSELPKAGFSAIVWPIDTCQHRVRFTNVSEKYDSLVWDFGDGNKSNNSSSSFDYFYANGGQYTVTLHAYNSCDFPDSLSSVINVKCLVGLKDQLENLDISIHPNPATNEVEITGTDISDLSNVKIMDLKGNVLMDQSYKPGYNLSIRSLEPGLYLLRFRTKRGLAIRRLVKI